MSQFCYRATNTTATAQNGLNLVFGSPQAISAAVGNPFSTVTVVSQTEVHFRSPAAGIIAVPPSGLGAGGTAADISVTVAAASVNINLSWWRTDGTLTPVRPAAVACPIVTLVSSYPSGPDSATTALWTFHGHAGAGETVIEDLRFWLYEVETPEPDVRVVEQLVDLRRAPPRAIGLPTRVALAPGHGSAVHDEERRTLRLAAGSSASMEVECERPGEAPFLVMVASGVEAAAGSPPLRFAVQDLVAPALPGGAPGAG
jgi:hypothetical protein